MGVEEDVKKINHHWNYFLALESDMAIVSRYIEFSTKNDSVFSIELAHILFAASSECEVVAKSICERLEPQSTRENMGDCREIIMRHHSDIANENIFIPKYNLKVDTPFELFAEGKRPAWWNSYNLVKHQRHLHFEEATLKNAMLAMGALQILIFYNELVQLKGLPRILLIHPAVKILLPESQLFRFHESYYYDWMTPRFRV